jgi:drug/metabolite transporter (DMT)-like permease
MVGGIGVALLGAGVMSGGGLLDAHAVGANPLWGNTLALLGALMAAGYVLAGRTLRQRISLIPYVLIVYGVATVVLGGFAAAGGSAFAGYPAREWGLFLAMAIGPGILGHTLINWSLEYVESTVVSVSLLAEPLGSALLALVVFWEVPGRFTILGGAIALVGIFVTARARRVPAGPS